jgi:type I restriction enzyme S subunit
LIEWLPDVPKRWTVERGRFVFRQLALPPEPTDGVVTVFRDGEVTLRENRRADGFMVALQELGYQHVRRGDLVIHGMDAFAGAIGVSDSAGKCTPEYAVLEPLQPGFSNNFFARCLRVMAWHNFIYVICPSVRERAPRFRFETFKDVMLPVPPPDEQRRIAAFLDRKTAATDALVAKKERLVELLREKRQAVITQAVTKGLDPNVPMKESGVEWIGLVPTHWSVVALKRLVATRITDGPHETPEILDDGVPFLSAEAVVSGRLDFSRKRGFIASADHVRFSKKCRPMKNDVLLIKSGSTTGNACIVEDCDDFNIWSPLALLRACRQLIYPRFLFAAVSLQLLPSSSRDTMELRHSTEHRDGRAGEPRRGGPPARGATRHP